MHTLTQGDGRTLAYEIAGPSGGDAVVFFHGGLFSRLVAPPAAVLDELGVRLVTFDRPGYGRSDPAATTLVERVRDVEALLNALGFTRARLVAWSAGAPHALACAALLPDRIERVDAVACPTIDGRQESHPMLELARDDKDGLRSLVDAGIASSTPADAIERYIRDSSYLAAGRNQSVRDLLVRALGEGVRQGSAGAVDDLVAIAAPWEFSLEDVLCPVRIWHGAHDSVRDSTEAAAIADALPDADLTVVDGGHDVICELWPDVLGRITTRR
jgi:pimeloyl-ACP methyl ester carboxylesterase